MVPGILALLFSGATGYEYHRYRKTNIKYNYEPEVLNKPARDNSPYDDYMHEGRATPPYEQNQTPVDNMLPHYDFDVENGYDEALNCIMYWRIGRLKKGARNFPSEVITAVEKIEKTFFPEGKPAPIKIGSDVYLKESAPTISSLKRFPTSIDDCKNVDEYFAPLSWNDGKGDFDGDDPYMLHKVLYQYLCRLLCFVPNTENLVVRYHIRRTDGTTALPGNASLKFVKVLLGFELPYPYITGSSCNGDYTQFFEVAYDDSERLNRKDSPVKKLIDLVAAMYRNNKPLCNRYREGHEKIGVLCGRQPRNIDN